MTIVSTASVLLQSDETYGFDSLAPFIGTWRNIQWDDAGGDLLVWGRQFSKFGVFDWVRANFKFTNLTPTIPANAKIISAVLRGTAFATSTALDFFSVIRVLSRDDIWVPPSTSGWKTASTITGPQPDLHTAADVEVFNLGVGSMVNTAITTTHTWPIRDNADSRHLRAGQGVTIESAGTLGFVDIEIDKTGAPGGNIWCEVYSQDGSGLADALLATSDTRPAADAPTAPGRLRFTFSGGDQIALALNQQIVIVLNGDYALSATDNVAMAWTRGGYDIGTFQIDGTGRGFDSQSYPMQRNFQNVAGDGFVVWIAPQFFVGVDYDTPDLSLIFQGHIMASGYVEGDPLALSIERSLFLSPGATADRRWASSTHVTFQSVRLIVEWRDRAIRVTA